MLTFSETLPIDEILPALLDTLGAQASALLHAPPGAGKTTRVPLALLGADWLRGQKIVMLEPRRLAARAAARFMAKTLGEAVGETVGYRIRLETKVGPRTRIEVVTEGVLTRMLQSDPELSGIGCVIFDEFHERSLNADLGLALCLETQAALRDDLRLLIMSATLDCEPVAALMGGCPVLSSRGRAFPVDTKFLPPARPDARIEDRAAAAVRRAVSEEDGSILVFLPGAGEIRRTAERLEDLAAKGVSVHPLFGTLPQKEQDAAIAPAPEGTRKVVLATAIAETSLTIEGIRVVIDCGLARVPRFDPRSGMTRLATERVSRASADQRRGRAGRLGPGVCYRLWSEGEDMTLKPFPAPEIKEADLAPLALELALWGVADETRMAWLDLPPAGNMAQARDLLTRLGALDRNGRVTPHGHAIARLPLHPRLAHMAIRGRDLGKGGTACLLAALLAERDILRGAGADLRDRLYLLAEGKGSTRPACGTLNKGALHRVRDAAAHIRRMADISGREETAIDGAGEILALAYPDRVAQRTGVGQFRLAGGRRATLSEQDPLAHEDFLAVADLGGEAARTRIWLAAPISKEEIEEAFPEGIERGEFVVWDARSEAVSARRQTRFGQVILEDAPLPGAGTTDVTAAVIEGIRDIGLHCLPWDRETESLRARIAFLRSLDAPGESGWPDVSDEGLLATLEDWLGPFLTGVTRRSQFKKIDLENALKALLPWEMQKRLDTEAPTHLRVPSGSNIRLDYTQEGGPILPVKLQEMFGARETPTIAGGRYALAVHLLSPARRPLAITRDLPSFWANGYPSVKAEMKGRYPKHPWPDDPLAAQPTRHTKRKM